MPTYILGICKVAFFIHWEIHAGTENCLVTHAAAVCDTRLVMPRIQSPIELTTRSVHELAPGVARRAFSVH
jgi:hypothetical protein